MFSLKRKKECLPRLFSLKALEAEFHDHPSFYLEIFTTRGLIRSLQQSTLGHARAINSSIVDVSA